MIPEKKENEETIKKMEEIQCVPCLRLFGDFRAMQELKALDF